MKRPKEYFRAGAGAVVTDNTGRVLVFERRDIRGAWQFPQGGMKRDESPSKTIFRELKEETGLTRSSVRLIARYPGLLTYELPPAARTPKTGRGQSQYWFFFRLTRPQALSRFSPSAEFGAFEWVTFGAAVNRVIAFKRPVYRRLQDFFETLKTPRHDR